MNASKPARAFTLIELLIVVLILGILTAAAYPTLAANFNQMKADALARQLAEDFRYAQMLAVRTGIQHRVSFSFSEQAWAVRRWDGSTWQLCKHPITKKDWKYVISGDSRYGGARIADAWFGTDTYIIFDKYGSPDSGGYATLTVHRATRTIRVAPLSGRVTVE